MSSCHSIKTATVGSLRTYRKYILFSPRPASFTFSYLEDTTTRLIHRQADERVSPCFLWFKTFLGPFEEALGRNRLKG